MLAAGCEDGCVRLFDILDGGLDFMRAFDKQVCTCRMAIQMGFYSSHIVDMCNDGLKLYADICRYP